MRERTEQGEAIYELDEDAPRATCEPDLIVTQALCAVCAVSYDDVRAVAERLRPRSPQVISLDPHDARRGARRRAHARRRRPTAKDAGVDLVAGRGRAASTACGSRCADAPRPRVAALEWLDPVFVAGHWTPQLIELRGRRGRARPAGRALRAARAGRRSRRPRPTSSSSMPCGYDAARALEEALRVRATQLAALGARAVVAVDAAAYFSRPGPRLVDGLELLAHVLHPDRVPEAPGAGARRRALGRWLRPLRGRSSICTPRPAATAPTASSR